MLLTDVEVEGVRLDVRVVENVVIEIGALRALPDEHVVEGRGGALVPGLHDHHIHLHALAADRRSVDCSVDLWPLRSAVPGPDGWLRGVRANVSVDRYTLDRLVPDRPVRVQHRSGALWMLNSAALAQVVLDGSADVERDEEGTPTGRLWRYDARLRQVLPDAAVDLSPVVAELTSYGITRVTDATPDLDPTSVRALAACDLPVALLGDPGGTAPWKILLRDHDLPTYEELRDQVERHRPRPVAVHCVTRESLLLTLAVLDDLGRMPGDRIEHGAVIPEPAALAGLVVVTQPAFPTTREFEYRRDVDDDDLPHLYRYRSLLEAGVRVLPSSDAPYGPADPWAVMRAARDRELGTDERVDPGTVLRGYQDHAKVQVGAPAGLTLLHSSLDEALDALDSSVVRTTWSTPQHPPEEQLR